MKIPVFVLILSFLALFSCANKQQKMEMAERDSSPMAEAFKVDAVSGDVDVSQQPRPIERKLIKTGQLSIEVDDLNAVKNQIEKTVGQMNGYISSEIQNNVGYQLNISLTIRIPISNFDTLTASVEKLGKRTESKSLRVEDVTEEFIDVEARLKTKKELETRYREILRSANKVDELLSVERELNNVRSEIESMEGRLKYLTNQVSYSTLDLTLFQKISTDFGFFGRFGESIGEGWNNFLSFVVGLVSIWPFLLLMSVGLWFFIKWRKKKKE